MVLDVLEHLELLASLEETKVAMISWKEEVADYVQVSGGFLSWLENVSCTDYLSSLSLSTKWE